MLAMKKELIISLADLRYISITCPRCKTQVVLDMKEPSEFSQKHDYFSPNKCPGCLTLYDSAIEPAVANLQRFYQSLLPVADRITFRTEAENTPIS
jgi:phage FluMu protein Com